jgi:Tfp pilus assembly protein PilF
MRTARPRHRAVLVAVLAVLFFLPPNTLGQTAHATQPPDTAEPHLGKGYDALKQDRYEVAAEEFRAALAIDPSLVLRAQFPLAVALFEQHRSADARHEFEACAARWRTTPTFCTI